VSGATRRPPEHAVHVASGPGEAPLPARLIILIEPPEATEAARHALRCAAVKHGRQLDPRSLAADMLAVYRLR